MIDLKQLFSPKNRGVLIDIVVFVIQLLLMRMIVVRFDQVVRQAGEDGRAKVMVGCFFLGLCFLQPLGVILKRWVPRQIHRDEEGAYLRVVDKLGCYYLVSQILLIGTGLSFLATSFSEAQVFDRVCLAQLAIAIAVGSFNLWIVRLYLTPPKHKPPIGFLQSTQSNLLGDLLLFLSILMWQVLWGYLILNRPSGIQGPEALIWLAPFMVGSGMSVSGKLGWFLLAVFVFYLSPRFAYLIDDRKRKLTWLTILLANSPVLYRILVSH